MKWNAQSIVIHNWPELKNTVDGRWERLWEIILEDNIPSTVSISDFGKKLSTHENEVSFRIEGEKKIIMRVITKRWGWEDDLYFFSYHLFKQINDTLGDISTIQGQKRNLWPPWLNVAIRNHNHPL